MPSLEDAFATAVAYGKIPGTVLIAADKPATFGIQRHLAISL
jgi:hypothetical protein